MADSNEPAEAGDRKRAALAGHNGDAGVARELVVSSDPSVRATALGSLARLNALSLDDIRNAVADESPEVRRRVATIIATKAGFPPTELISLLHDDDHLVAEAAAFALGELENNSVVTVAALCEMAQSHADPLCREAAVAALGAIGDHRCLDTLVHALDDKPQIRRRAVIAISAFDDPRVEQCLDRAARDRDWQVRQVVEYLRKPEPG